MLQSLIIQNYALIAELNIRFDRGFSVITGETGAGKSILLGAIGLLLGQRADTRAIKAGCNRCVIEAEFDLTGYGLDHFFTEQELDFDGHSCIIRRELTAAGKSRAFINDTPAQVAQLRELGERLIDIHSQHQNLLLQQEDFQLNVIDIIAHDTGQRQQYAAAFQSYQEAVRQLAEARSASQRNQADEDYLRFQLAQLEELDLQPGKQEEYEQEAQLLEHAEEIRQALWSAGELLDGDEAILSSLHTAERQLASITSLLPAAEELSSRIESCRIELKDVAESLSSEAGRVDVSPQRLQEVQEWLSQLYTLQKKHHVADDEQLMALREDFRQRLSDIDHSEERLQALEQAVKDTAAAVRQEGERLSVMRRQAAKDVEQQMHGHLIPLGIPHVKFQVQIDRRSEPEASGLDQVTFLFSANKNAPLQPISNVASGGEIARVMLSLKAIISASVSLPTIIFDEIDTGVSGHIAERMALMMKEMGDGGRQVISITHLPQIAALGAHHYRVYKEDNDEGTTSHIVALSPEERVTEIAHMLSGSSLTDAAIENAKSLLRHA